MCAGRADSGEDKKDWELIMLILRALLSLTNSKVRGETANFCRMARLAKWHLARRLGRKLYANTHQGRYRVILYDKYISKPLYVEGSFEWYDMVTVARTLELLGRGLGGRVFLDIGANIGVIGVTAVLRFKAARCLAVEPGAENFSLLQENIKLNGVETQILAFNMGLSDTSGESILELSEDNSGDHRVRGQDVGRGFFNEHLRKTTKITLDTLDSVVFGQSGITPDSISVAWIDTQGHEAHVCRGGERLWACGVPAYMEFSPYHLKRAGETVQSVVSAFSRSFSMFGVIRRGDFFFYPIEELGTFWNEVGETCGHDNLLFIPLGFFESKVQPYGRIV